MCRSGLLTASQSSTTSANTVGVQELLTISANSFSVFNHVAVSSVGSLSLKANCCASFRSKKPMSKNVSCSAVKVKVNDHGSSPCLTAPGFRV